MLGHHSQGKNKNYLKVARGLPLNCAGVSGGKIATESEPERREQLTLSEDAPNGLSVGRIGKNH